MTLEGYPAQARLWRFTLRSSGRWLCLGMVLHKDACWALTVHCRHSELVATICWHRVAGLTNVRGRSGWLCAEGVLSALPKPS